MVTSGQRSLLSSLATVLAGSGQCLLPGRNALLLGQTGQCHRIAAVASRTHVRDDVVPRPRSEPGPSNKYEFRHGGKLRRRYIRLVIQRLRRRSS
jgi:hypothetical protein